LDQLGSVREACGQDLDGDVLGPLGVLADVDGPHAAAAPDRGQLVAAQELPEERVGRRQPGAVPTADLVGILVEVAAGGAAPHAMAGNTPAPANQCLP